MDRELDLGTKRSANGCSGFSEELLDCDSSSEREDDSSWREKEASSGGRESGMGGGGLGFRFFFRQRREAVSGWLSRP